MELDCSLPCSTEPAISSNSEPGEWENFIYLSSILTLSLAVEAFKWHQYPDKHFKVNELEMQVM
jgi:hypothetical protein